MPKSIEHTLTELRTMKVDSLLEKKKHYNAADRLDRLNKSMGCPVVIINLLLGSLLWLRLTDGSSYVYKWIGASMAFFAAVLSGLQTFFGPGRKIEGHQRLGSKFLAIVKQCKRLEAYCLDGDVEGIQEKVEAIARSYDECIKDAIPFPTNRTDYEIARAGIQNGEETYTEVETS